MMKFHPAANAFPLMDKDRFNDLIVDIEAKGLLVPIVLCDGMILDGRNRYLACEQLGIIPQTIEYNGDPWAYVWSMNGQRRDLSAEQRAQIWIFCNRHSDEWIAEQEKIAEEANRKRRETMLGLPYAAKGEHRKSEENVVVQSGPPHSPTDKHSERYIAAHQAGVSKTAIARAEALETARPDLAEKVRTGEIKPAEAHRQAKRDEIMQKSAALPDDKFNVIYADPPWSYNDKQTNSISESYGAAEKSYYQSMMLIDLPRPF